MNYAANVKEKMPHMPELSPNMCQLIWNYLQHSVLCCFTCAGLCGIIYYT
jgi:hypothetical protein